MLMDTHIWIRWLLPTDPLPITIVETIESEENLYISSISCWEATLLYQRKRIELSLPLDAWLTEALIGSDVQVLPITCQIAKIAGALPEHHKDPADRIIIATAIVHNMCLASFDQHFPAYAELKDLLCC